MKKGIILYQYNKFNNDLTYIKEYYNKKEIEKDFNINANSIYQYIVDDVDNITENTKKLHDGFVLFWDY